MPGYAPVGRLEILDEVRAKALAVRRGRDALAPSAGGAGDRAAALYRAEGFLLEGEVYAATGRAAAARAAGTHALDAIAPAAEGSTRADLL